MSKKRNRIGDKSFYRILLLVGMLVRRLNRAHAAALARITGDIVYDWLKIRRDLVETNLTLTFPEKTGEEIRSIARQVYRNLAENALEVLRLPLIRDRQDIAELVDIEGDEAFREWQRSGRSGAVLVSAHYGNWELMAMAFGLLVNPITIIVKRLRNRQIDLKMNEYRTMRGNRVVYPKKSVREGLRLLQSGGVLAILGDQSDPDEANYGEFLGRRTTMFHGAAFFALRANVPMFMPICSSNGDGRYTIRISRIETSDLSFSKADIATLAARYTRAIETEIRHRPEEWFWLHNRWKRTGRG